MGICTLFSHGKGCITKVTCFDGGTYCMQALCLDPGDTTRSDKSSWDIVWLRGRNETQRKSDFYEWSKNSSGEEKGVAWNVGRSNVSPWGGYRVCPSSVTCGKGFQSTSWTYLKWVWCGWGWKRGVLDPGEETEKSMKWCSDGLYRQVESCAT